MSSFPQEKVKRLIKLSITKPLNPSEYVPWDEEIGENDKYLPECLVSLEGHPQYDKLSSQQKRELARHELVQVIYSYAWSEGLACLFFNRHLLKLKPQSTEYRFLIRELIEEFQHQQMFSDVVMKINGDPIEPRFWHRIIGKFTVKYAPADWVFMSVLAIEMVSDSYGKLLRKDKSVFEVLRKSAELHAIEEGRHMYYTKLWMDKYFNNAGWMRRSIYSLLFLFNIYFMRSLYCREAIFERIEVKNHKTVYKTAKQNYRRKFARHCLEEALRFVGGFGGFNVFTRALWSKLLAVDFSNKEVNRA